LKKKGRQKTARAKDRETGVSHSGVPTTPMVRGSTRCLGQTQSAGGVGAAGPFEIAIIEEKLCAAATGEGEREGAPLTGQAPDHNRMG